MSTICCFGEVLLRFSPVANGGWIQQSVMPVYVGGAELNVAMALANWNVPVRYSTGIPENALASDITDYITKRGVDPSGLIRNKPGQTLGNRIGSYYLPQGSDLKNAGVIYDRAGSAFAELKPGEIDWEPVLQGVSRLHISAISPALSAQAADVCRELLETASEKGISISIDLNYRARLWQYGVKPVDVMPDLVQYCEVVMGNIWAANTLLGIPVGDHITEQSTQAEYVAHAQATSEAIQARFPRCKVVANTFRFSKQPTGIHYYTTLFTNGQSYVSPTYEADTVIDQIGSGDCFMAGLLYGLYNNHEPQTILNFATAAAFGKLSEVGDDTKQSVADVLRIVTG
ncbi:MAG: sugar kinase [Cytophagaceae bacterium]|nr:MAG: sugar kinase [Cytophagaceae bacterium]